MPVIRGERVSRAGIAAAAHQAARQDARHQAFLERRHRVFLHVAKEVNAGRMSPRVGHATLQQAGFIPGGVVEKPIKGVGGFVAKTIGDVATNAVYAPAGIYQAGKAVGLDVRDTAHGHPTLKRTGGIGKVIATGMATDFRHPLRHPGNVGLDILGLLSLGAGTAVRSTAAAGELGAEGSALTRVGRAGRALATKPKPMRRAIRANGLEVHPVPSTNPVMRAAQEIHDRAISSGHRVPGAIRGTAAKRAGFELKQEGRVLDAVANAPAAALHQAGSKGRATDTAAWRGQQMALRVRAEGRTTAERIAYEQKRIDELGGSPRALMEKRRHAANIRDLISAREHLDESTGVPVIKDRHLQALYDQTKSVAQGRDQLLEQIGLLTPEQLAERPHMPGRVIGGATFEKPTPGKLGVPSQALIKARTRVARLEALHERARGRIVPSKPSEIVPAAPQKDVYFTQYGQSVPKHFATEVKNQVHNIHDEHGNVIGSLVYDARPGRRSVYVESVFIRPEARSVANLQRLVAPLRHETRPIKAEFQNARLQRVFERAVGRGQVTGTALPRQTAGDIARGDLPQSQLPPLSKPRTRAAVGAKGVATADRLGGALSVARDELQRLEAGAARRVTPTGLLGQEGFTGGEFRVPSTSKRPPRGSVGGATGSLAYPQAPGSVTHGYSGALLRQGLERNDVSRLVAESAMEGNKYRAVLRLRDRIVKAAVPSPHNLDDYLPVRLDNLKSGKLPQFVKDAQTLPEGGARSALEQAQATTRLQGFWDSVFLKHPSTLTPEAAQAFQRLADEGKIAWVHKDLIRQVRQPSLLAPMKSYIAEGPRAVRVAAGIMPAINRASKAAILYLKPAYAAPNILGNAALALVQQGWAAPRNLAQAARLNASIGPEALHALDAAVGEGITASLHDVGTNVGARAINKAADVWSKGVDTPFRRSAFLHEARRYGYRTPEQVQRLLTDATHETDLVEVANRANRALIDYGRLGPLEREIARHLVMFYPWVKGSTMYAGHFVTEHPMQAAVTNQLGQEGRDQARRDLGVGPSYLQGIFRVGGTRDIPKIVNPSGAAILTTPAQVVQSVLALWSKNPTAAANLAQNLTPAVGAALSSFITHRDPLTDRQLTGRPVVNFGKQLTQGLPQVSLYRKLAGTDKRDPKDMLFPPSRGLAVTQFGLGSAVPKPMNRAKFLSLGEKEQRGTLSRVDRVRYDEQKNADAFKAAAVKAKLIPANAPLPTTLRNVLHLNTLREANLAIWQDKVGHKLTEADRFTADVKQLQSWKKITPAKAAEALAWAQTAAPRDLEKQRRAIGEQFYGSGVLSAARKQIRDADPNATLP